MRAGWPLVIAVFVWSSFVFPANAQGSLSDLFANEAEAAEPGPAQPPKPQPPAAEAIAFPSLMGCENSLAGLPLLQREPLVAHLERRIGLWSGASFTSVPSFRTRRQADFAFGCFERRLAVLAAYLPENAKKAGTRELVTELDTRFGSELTAFLSGTAPPGETEPWWREADEALALLVRLEISLADAQKAGERQREGELVPVRAALAEFGKTIADVDRLDETIAPEERVFWLRALAWRALAAGLAMDRLQLSDLQREPELAHQHLRSPAGVDPLSAVAGAVAAAIAQARTIRENKSILDAGAPRDWATPSELRRIAEELYLVHVMGQTIGRRIAQWQRDEAETKKLSLQLEHDAAVAAGEDAATSGEKRSAAWRAFREEQRQKREGALARWDLEILTQRNNLVVQGAHQARRADDLGLPR